jgi:hypothetical protein
MNIFCFCGINIGIISNGITIDDSIIQIVFVRMGLVKHIHEGFSSIAIRVAGLNSTICDINPPDRAKLIYHRYQVTAHYPPLLIF